MTLKEEILTDIDDVFLNLDEFGETQLVEGKEITCIFDDEVLKTRQGSSELAIDESTALLFAKVEDLPKKKAGALLNINHKEYIIDDWKTNLGMAEIALHQNVTTC